MGSTEGLTTGNINTLKQIDLLIDEALQLYELETQKSNTVTELFNSFRIITEVLGFSVTIHPQIFNLPSDTHVILTPNLDLVMLQSNGKTEIKKLESFSAEVVSYSLDYIIPQLIEMIRREKTSLTEKMTFLRSAAQRIQELRNITENHDSVETQSYHDKLK